jgi:penicillin amidase
MATLVTLREFLTSALPDVTSDIDLEGLDGSIQIHRDTYGIPHVKAESVHDAFFGQGFVTAQDRLWHMDTDRRKAYGRWAEFAGKSGVEQDLMMRRFQIGPTVERDYQAVHAHTRAMLDAYAEGVNAFINSTTTLPIEYSLVGGTPECWRPSDCLAVFKARHIMMGVFEGKLWRAKLIKTLGVEKAAGLLRGYQPGHLTIVPPESVYDGEALNGIEELHTGLDAVSLLEDIDAGSNNWALHGSRTASGKPLLAGDPHRGLDTPNVYYQNHIACPEFDAIGLSFPGCPGFPHFGHNANVAWCVTHAGADYQDVFIERFRDGDPGFYEFKGAWKQAEVRHEIIKVRGAAPIELDVIITHHGPVIAGNPENGHAIAFRYTATAGDNLGSQSILHMLTATSGDELDESMRHWVDPCNNFLFADVHGNIGYLNRGRVPIRSSANAWLPVPGWTGEHEWDGIIPFEELARSRNPETDYLVTANNRIVGKDYPYYIALDFAPEYRARRIIARLKPLEAATVEDMASIHAERVSLPAQTYKEIIAKIVPGDLYVAQAQQRIVAWDGSMERNAIAPTIYSAFRTKLQARLIGHLLGPLAQEALSATGRGAPRHVQQLTSLLVTMARDGDTSYLPLGEDWVSVVSQALDEGVSDLRQKLGEDMDLWQWGTVHHTRPRHTLSDSIPGMAELLDPPSVPMGGDGDTPQAGSYSAANPYTMMSMSVARYVFDAGDWDNSRWIVPLGSSGHPGSPHYADQTPLWAEIDLIPMLYDWDTITRESESQQRLNPR